MWRGCSLLQGFSLNRSFLIFWQVGWALQIGPEACAGTSDCPGISLCPLLCPAPLPPHTAWPCPPVMVLVTSAISHYRHHCSASTNTPLPTVMVRQAGPAPLCLGPGAGLDLLMPSSIFPGVLLGAGLGKSLGLTSPRHDGSSPLQCKKGFLVHQLCSSQLWHWREVAV